MWVDMFVDVLLCLELRTWIIMVNRCALSIVNFCLFFGGKWSSFLGDQLLCVLVL